MPDQPAVEENGTPLGPGIKTYGLSLVMNLAKNNPFEASRTADAFVYFAIAAHLSGFDWASGYAQGIF